MDYHSFVMKLNQQMPGSLLAYDQHDDACVLLFTHERAKITVTIPASVISQQQQQQRQLIDVLCDRLRSSQWSSGNVKLTLKGTALEFEDLGK